jgi:hypothetical protein
LGWSPFFLICLACDPSHLMSNEKGIKEKLTQLLKERDFSCAVEDAWIMTMPHYLGFNPLTICFCYSKETLIVVVFEVLHPFTSTNFPTDSQHVWRIARTRLASWCKTDRRVNTGLMKHSWWRRDLPKCTQTVVLFAPSCRSSSSPTAPCSPLVPRSSFASLIASHLVDRVASSSLLSHPSPIHLCSRPTLHKSRRVPPLRRFF